MPILLLGAVPLGIQSLLSIPNCDHFMLELSWILGVLLDLYPTNTGAGDIFPSVLAHISPQDQFVPKLE